MPSPGASFFEVITEATNYFVENGFDSVERLEFWIKAIRDAAQRTMTPNYVLEQELNKTLTAAYRAQIERGGILRQHSGVSRFALQKVAPKLRLELDRRIMASAALIKLNRQQTIEDTLRRFSGWATSIPAGGTDVAKRREIKDDIRKPLASLPFKTRRVLIDQGHKFTANLNNILAEEAGAIALIWHSHWREAGYHYRPDHKKRDMRVYLIRDSWAQKDGFVKANDNGYYDQITSVGEEVSCRCYAQYLYSLRSLPTNMLTGKGKTELVRVRIAA